MSRVGEHISAKFHRFQALYLQGKCISAVYYGSGLFCNQTGRSVLVKVTIFSLVKVIFCLLVNQALGKFLHYMASE